MKIKIEKLTKKYKNDYILNNINLDLNENHIYSIIGRNGSGKTTLMKCLTGLTNYEGNIKYDGQELRELEIPKNTRALIENPDMISSLTGFENLKLLASIENKITDEEIIEAMISVGLKDSIDKKYGDYSLGMKQKLGIAQVIMEKPDLLIFDEPFNSLDSKSSEEIKELLKKIKQDKKIILISTNIIEDIESYSDFIYTIENGRLKEYEK